MLAIVFPAQMMLADESASAMLYTNGAAWVNGTDVPKSAAVFSGDLLQTRSDSTASLQANGSNVMVMADSLVKYQGSAVELEHGALRVTTSRGLEARVGDVTVKPAADAWTEFQVTDVDGRVQIAANKGDVTVQDDKGTTTVSQGQQTTRDDTSNTDNKKKKHRKGQGAPAAGVGGIMSSTPAIITGLAIVGGVTVWVVTRSGSPVSPDCPSNPCN